MRHAENASKPKVASRIARVIVREIRRRGLVPGDKLISEQKMVERYGVARGSLREALRFLEMQGVLRIKSGPGGGPVVESPSTAHFASTLALLLQSAGASFRAVVEARAAIEPDIAGLAAERGTEQDHARLAECLAAMQATIEDAAAFREENRRFHDLVALASGNPVFAFLIPALHALSEGAPVLYTPSERRRILRATTAIHAAIAARNAALAADTMRRFFEASLVHLARAHPHALDRPLSWEDP
ncbi:MAG: FadR family transcriptional regulator [Deltaproteobacteria bacterium]|nr:FadR family transcriptional regulator [Deltaproteobacteria bacterium]